MTDNRSKYDQLWDKIIPGVLWGIVAAAVIAAVSLGLGWDPFRESADMGDPSGIDTADLTIFPDDGAISDGADAREGGAEADGTGERIDDAPQSEDIGSASGSDPDIPRDVPADEGTAGDSLDVSAATEDPSAEGESSTDEGTAPDPDEQSPSSARPVDPALPVVSMNQMVQPVAGSIVRPFGWFRYPALGEWRYSTSVVFEPDPADDEVRAALAGRIRDLVYDGGAWRLTIEHAGGWTTEYDGLSEVTVDSYEIVETNQVLGHTVPGGGFNLRFAVLHGDDAVDPTTYIGEQAVEVAVPVGP